MKAFALNCQTCGGTLEYSADGLSAVCPYCGNKYNFAGAKSEALTLALNRANAMRIACDFDDAIREYKLITDRNPEDSEAWWGLALSKYGIEYMRDSRTGLLVPTCRRTVSGSILGDEYFKNAVKFARPEQAESYRQRAEQIDRLQAAIKRRLAGEEDFDVFLCFRSADKNGAPTRERVIARRIYDELTRRGIRTFFSEVTLKNRLGEDFEPIIYKALYSCKFFILIACSAENINAPWVKNEWSRFRDREEAEHLSGACCAVFDGITPADLPPFLRSQQGVNLAKYPAGGYEIELADSIQARFFRTASAMPERHVSYMGRDASELLARAWRDLSGELYESAYTKFLQVLDIAPHSGEAWWGCFLAERHAYSAGYAAQKLTYEDALTIKDDKNLRNAELYGNGEIKSKVASFKKMCAFRSSELAAESDVAVRSAQKKLGELEAERKKVFARREKNIKRLQRQRKTAATKPSSILKLMVIPIVFFLLVFGVVGFATQEIVMLYVAIGMVGMCLFAALVSYFGMKSNVSRANSEIASLEGEIVSDERRLSEIAAERERLERTLEESRRRSGTFKDVFGA